MTPRPDTAGSASVLTVTFAGLLLFVGAALGGAVSLVIDHRRAQAAADLAALAGAASADPCPEAARIAAANGATLAGCRRAGPDVIVRVVVAGHPWVGRTALLTAEARAGPS